MELLAYYDWWLTAVLVALPLLAVAVPARSLEPIRPLVCRAASWPPLPWVLFAGSIPLFWLARVRMHALGDSIKWFTVVGNAVERYRPFSEMRWHNASLDMPGLEFINFQQALDLAAHVGVYALLHLFGVDEPEAAYRWVSIVAGGCFVLALWSLANRLSRRESPVGQSTDPIERIVVFGVLACLGILQLFCGYGESYTLVTVLTAVYLTLSLDCLAGKRPPWHAGIVLALGVGTHMLAASLVPSFLLVAWYHPRWGALLRRRQVMIPLAATGLVGFVFAYARLYHGLQLPLWTPDQPGRYALLSLQHAATLANALLLVGPFGLIWGLVSLFRRLPPRADRQFLGVAAAGACLLIGVHDITMGGRDWDLMSFPALPLTAWGLLCLKDQLSGDTLGRLSRAVIPVMVMHTALWIGTNADEDRTLARLENLLPYANLPTHYHNWTLGYYYTNVLDEHYDLAADYFARAVATTPAEKLREPGGRPYSYRKFLAVALGTSGQYLACIEESRAIYALQSEPVLDENDLAVHQEYAESLLKLAQQADDEGDSSSALVYWRESLTPLGVLARETEDALSFWNLSAAHRRLGNHVQSIEDFRRSLGMSQDPEADMIALGDLYLNEGEKELAATAYAQLLIPTVGGVSSDGFKRAGVRLYKVGHLDESCMAYEAALVVDPLNHLARMNLAWNRYLQHRFDEAIRQYQLVITQRETSEAAFGLALAFLHAGHIDSAWTAYERAVSSFGTDGGRKVMADENLRRLASQDIQPETAAAILQAHWP